MRTSVLRSGFGFDTVQEQNAKPKCLLLSMLQISACLRTICRAPPMSLCLPPWTLTLTLTPPASSSRPAEISVSLLSVIVTFCGIVLLSVSLFVSWKLCWLPWRDKEGGGLSLTSGLLPGSAGIGSLGGAAGTLKLSQTSPDVPNSEGGCVSAFHLIFTPRALVRLFRPKPMTHQLSSPDFHGEEKEQVTSIGQIKPELYRPKGDQGEGKQGDTCGKISFLLRYAFNTEQLVVKILKALDLPAKDANGFSDPYVKIYLLPDRKKKFQTKVHRKTLNPVFNETFQFGVPLNELHSRKLHFSVYDFDRFSRHDLIGQVVVDNLLDFSEGSGDKPVWRDIVEGTAEKADLGELNFSLCYLPTAGRLTATIIKATNLKAMDLTGFSDPYVKASLVCDGRRLKKRKTSIKKNTLNPTYNEALVFDIPNENIESVSIVIAVMDYDCIGHNEVIGMCRVGSEADGPGREHWAAMLANPRKPIEHWHQLVEVMKRERERERLFDDDEACLCD
uniref:Synaptotagmin III n=1 Tax=Salarias fasciatus TaxID=181472 RepID=A0A672GXM3_SALFA